MPHSTLNKNNEEKITDDFRKSTITSYKQLLKKHYGLSVDDKKAINHLHSLAGLYTHFSDSVYKQSSNLH